MKLIVIQMNDCDGVQSQDGGEFLAISGKLNWIPKPATLVAP